MEAGALTNINVALKVTAGAPDSSGIHRARVHCVDVQTRELIYAWLFEVEADKPMVQRSYPIQTSAGKVTPYKFAYANPLGEFTTLEFVSSKPALMEVRREKQGFEAHESRHVELLVPAQPRAGAIEEVILYVNDLSGKVSESLLFKIIVKD